MNKTDTVIIKETKYIALITGIMSVIMQAVFLLINKWDYTVLTGNVLSWFISVLNFYLMGVFVQKALSKDQKEAKTIIKLSMTYRMLMLAVVVALGVALPYFNTVAVLIALFFSRLAILIRPIINKNDN